MALPLANQPIDLLLDLSTNDLVVTTDLAFSSGIQAVVQSCQIVMQLFAGEWFLNLDAGIPYWQSIFGQKPAIAEKAARIAFRSALLEQVDGVIDVLQMDVEYDPSTRTLFVTWQVSTALGNTPTDTITVDIPGGGS